MNPFNTPPTSDLDSDWSSIRTVTTITETNGAPRKSAAPRVAHFRPDTRTAPTLKTDSTLCVFPTSGVCVVEPLYGKSPPTLESTAISTFTISSKNGKGKPWATLNLCVGSDSKDPSIPQIRGGSAIQGSLNMDIEGSLKISEIVIQLRGKIVTGAQEGGRFTFYEYEVPLWRQSIDGDLRKLQHVIQPEQFNGKFSGHYEFPIMFSVPTHFDLTTREARFPAEFDAVDASGVSVPVKLKKPRPSELPKSMTTISMQGKEYNLVCPAPASFSHPSVRAIIQYEITADIVYTGMRPTTKIKSVVNYIPSVVPSPSSLERQMAYTHGSHLSPPYSDSQGWVQLPSVDIQGKYAASSGVEDVTVTYKLYVAIPLIYVRGTSIPCYLEISSESPEAFGALADPKTPCVRLARTITHYFPPSGSRFRIADTYGVGLAGGLKSGPLHTPSPQRNSGKGGKGVLVGPDDGDYKMEGTQLESYCRWWNTPGVLGDVTVEETLDDTILFTKYLEGEIHLDTDLAPTSHATIFSIQYAVEMLQPKCNGFDMKVNTPETHKSTGNTSRVGTDSASPIVLAYCPVEIATMCDPRQPQPVIYSRPPRRRS